MSNLSGNRQGVERSGTADTKTRTQSNSIEPTFRERLERYYSFYEVQDGPEINDLVAKHGTNAAQNECFQQLIAKYGPEPPSVRDRRVNVRDSSVESLNAKKGENMNAATKSGNNTIGTKGGNTNTTSKSPTKSSGIFSAVKQKAGFFSSGNKSKPKKRNSEAHVKASHTSFALADETIQMKTFTIQPGNAHGWMYKSWETLDKWKMLYYVFDFGNLLMYECESEDKTVPPRNTLSLTNTRVGEDYTMINSLFCWNLFIRSDQEGKAPKIFRFGVQTLEQYNSWSSCLRANLTKQALAAAMSADMRPISASLGNVGGEGSESGMFRSNDLGDHHTDISDDDEHEEPSLGVQEKTNVDNVESNSSASASKFESGISTEDNHPSSSIMAKTDGLSLNPTVVIGSRRYNLRCVSTSTNAWLLSEAIRVYMRENNQDPEIIGLYNMTQNKDMELGDDIRDSFRPGDVIQAITTSTMTVPPSSADSNLGPIDAKSQGGDSQHSGPISSSVPHQTWYRKQRGDSAGMAEEADLPPSLFPGDATGLPLPPSTQKGGELLDAVKRSSAGASKTPSGIFSVNGSQGRHVNPGSSIGVPVWDGEIGGSTQQRTIWNSVKMRQAARKELSNWVPAAALATAKTLINAPHAMVPDWLSDEWLTSTSQNSVRVFASKQRPSKLLGLTLVPASPSQVLDCIVDIHQQQRWDPLLSSGSILELGQCSDVVHIQHKSMYLPPLTSLVPSVKVPVLPREYCVGRTWQRFGDGSFMIVLHPESHPCATSSSLLSVQAELSGGFIIRPIEIATGAEYSVVMYMVDADIKGWIPAAVAQQAKYQCIASLGGLRDYISWAVNQVP